MEIKRRRMRILDCFPYFNEREMLHMRIRMLHDYVDEFIILEGDRTHMGDPKAYGCREELKSAGLLTDKVRIVEIALPSLEEKPNPWARERMQRDAMLKYVKQGDLCIVSDCDEVMNPRLIDYYASVARKNPDRILRIPMVFLMRRADLRVFNTDGTPMVHDCAFMAMSHHLKCHTPSEIRESRSMMHGGLKYEDIFVTESEKIVEAGWHFSWMGDRERMIKKVKSYAHSCEFDLICDLSDENRESHPLGANDHVLRKYPWIKLPNDVFEEKTFKFMLPNLVKNPLAKNADMTEDWFDYWEIYEQMVDRFPSESKFVEVGCWEGRSSLFLVSEIFNSKKDIQLYCVDTWKGNKEHAPSRVEGLYGRFVQNMSPFEGKYEIMRMPSSEAAKKFDDESLDFVFLDASHEYEDVKSDIRTWIPKLKKGGILAGHDYFMDGSTGTEVKRAVEDSLSDFDVVGNCFLFEVGKKTRKNVIQFLIDQTDAKSYLEIGIDNGMNLEKLKCESKVGVDPNVNSPANFHMTSDEFFQLNKSNFDIIFIDGLHHADQVMRDINNSLKVLNDGGYVICHDMNPQKEEHQKIPFSGGRWNGDCWRAFLELRRTRSDLEMYVVDIDEGCGVIKKGHQKLLKIDCDLNFEEFDKKRFEWLDIVNWEEFKRRSTNKREFLKSLLEKFVINSDDPCLNYNLGMHYESIGHTASALSYFLRCTERSKTPEIVYECLLRGASCFEKQGKRNLTVRGLLQHAVSIMPKRPEAYYLLSKFYEIESNWQESYMMASIGEDVCELDLVSLHNLVDYPGLYSLAFQKGVAAWWCGLVQESRDIFLKILHHETGVEMRFVELCIKNLNMMNAKPFLNFKRENSDDLKVKFKGHENILINHSEAFQDMFVLSVLDGKKEGTYLEIGSGDPCYGNNTLLMEENFGWSGIAIDTDEKMSDSYNLKRKNKCFCRDGRFVDYTKFLKDLNMPKEIDYLQLDCDPPSVTYEILLALPLSDYKFAVITYEHDDYCDITKSFQDKSARHLESHGYIRVVKNVAPDNHRNYEDWWVNPDLVSRDYYEKFLEEDPKNKSGIKVLMKEVK